MKFVLPSSRQTLPPVVKDLIARIKEKALGTEVQTSLTPGQALVGIVHDD